MQNRYLLIFLLLVVCIDTQAQSTGFQFINQIQRLGNGAHYSGVAMAVVDFDGDGLDDLARFNDGIDMTMAYQRQPDGPFRLQPVGLAVPDVVWSAAAGDFDNDGLNDLFFGGYFYPLRYFKTLNDYAGFDTTQIIFPETFAQGISLNDINRDGLLDAFVCHDLGQNRIFANYGLGNFIHQPDWINLNTTPPSDNSGNYSAVWTDIDNDSDLDLYVVKCKQGVLDPADPLRINQLFINEKGVYVQDTLNTYGLRIGAQSWTADFGDIDNDGDLDCLVTNHDVSSQLLENDGTGRFTDISETAGILNTIPGLPIQGMFADFDNDGFLDILTAGTEGVLLHNNGNKTFSTMPNPFDQRMVESFALGDLNADGFTDLYAGYAKVYNEPGNIPDALWINPGNEHHHIGFLLRAVSGNRNAVGAKIRLYSALGSQMREIRAGQGYGISNSFTQRFGLGTDTEVDSAVVYWPSGQVDKLVKPAIDKTWILQEGGCLLPRMAVSITGDLRLCTGDTAVLSLPQGYNYSWTTGQTTASIRVAETGNYRATVTAPGGCTAVSNTVEIVLNPVEIPIITTSGDTTFCAGDSVTLTASPGFSYVWNTGALTPSITVGQSGSYSVTVQGKCLPGSSLPKLVTVLKSPLPQVTGDTILPKNQATLTAKGDSLLWYKNAADSLPIAFGELFTTPVLDTTTVYWVQNLKRFDLPNAFTGMKEHAGSNYNSGNFNGALFFDAYIPFRLSKVTVYTNVESVRKIELRSATNKVLLSKDVLIPEGISTQELNFDVLPGNHLILTTNPVTNQMELGVINPRLRRSDMNVKYPYELPGVLRITGSNGGDMSYYYFYNWEIDFYGDDCYSTRIPVTARVDSTSSVPFPAIFQNTLHIQPNPATDRVTVSAPLPPGKSGTLAVYLPTGSIVRQAEIFSHPYQLDLSGLAAGLYWVEVRCEGLFWRQLLAVW